MPSILTKLRKKKKEITGLFTLFISWIVFKNSIDNITFMMAYPTWKTEIYNIPVPRDLVFLLCGLAIGFSFVLVGIGINDLSEK